MKNKETEVKTKSGILDAELNIYNALKPGLVKKFKGKFVLIKDQPGEIIIVICESEKAAIHKGYDLFDNAPFFTKEIQRKERKIFIGGGFHTADRPGLAVTTTK